MVCQSNRLVLNIPSYRHRNDPVIDILYLLEYLFINLTRPMTINGQRNVKMVKIINVIFLFGIWIR